MALECGELGTREDAVGYDAGDEGLKECAAQESAIAAVDFSKAMQTKSDKVDSYLSR